MRFFHSRLALALHLCKERVRVQSWSPCSRSFYDNMNDPMIRNNEPARDVVKRKYCAKCQNHQRMEVVKGHKRHCTFKSCRCLKCRGTDEKRKITARNVQARREELLERARNMNALEEKPSVRGLEELRSKEESREGREALTTPVDFQDNSKDHSPASHEEGEDRPRKVAWKSILTLCDDIKGLEVHHLLHLILKEIAPTVEEARFRILQAMQEVAEEISRGGHIWDDSMAAAAAHYQWSPGYYHSLTKDSTLYKLPATLYHRPEPISAFTLPLLRAIPYGFSHALPSTSYPVPTHEEGGLVLPWCSLCQRGMLLDDWSSQRY